MRPTSDKQSEYLTAIVSPNIFGGPQDCFYASLAYRTKIFGKVIDFYYILVYLTGVLRFHNVDWRKYSAYKQRTLHYGAIRTRKDMKSKRMNTPYQITPLEK